MLCKYALVLMEREFINFQFHFVHCKYLVAFIVSVPTDVLTLAMLFLFIMMVPVL